jgi:hypothetical protein
MKPPARHSRLRAAFLPIKSRTASRLSSPKSCRGEGRLRRACCVTSLAAGGRKAEFVYCFTCQSKKEMKVDGASGGPIR